MNVIVFGGAGLLGRALVAAAPPDWKLLAPPHAQCDITDPKVVRTLLTRRKPAVVFNMAGFTGVDAAEDDPDTAHRINAEGAGNVAAACARAGAHLVHVSTDYVFDGNADKPYTEDARPKPLSVYAQSKLAGEQAVLEAHPGALVVRTQWLFGDGGRCFVGRMCERAQSGEPVEAVDDQLGRPSFAPDVAAILAGFAGRPHLKGLLNVANDGTATWFKLAQAVYRKYGYLELVTPVTTHQVPRRALRPEYSVLALDRLRALGVRPRHWRTALAEFLEHAAARPAA